MKKFYKKALVTGGTRGIGLAICKKLNKSGVDVTITGTKDTDNIIDGVQYFKSDFNDFESTKKLVDFIRAENFNILINNAGINIIGEFEKILSEDFDKVININLKTPFLLCQAVIPFMKSIKWGRIINITSIFGAVSKEYRAPYSSSKFGLDGMTAALSAELSEYGILSNCVAPGVIDTELTKKILGKKGIDILRSNIPIKRLGKPNEIANIVNWLASDENSYLTGQNIIIDGGFVRV